MQSRKDKGKEVSQEAVTEANVVVDTRGALIGSSGGVVLATRSGTTTTRSKVELVDKGHAFSSIHK